MSASDYRSTLQIPLHSRFRYHSEPWLEASCENEDETLVRGEEVVSFARRLQHSTGGTHLVTGYRGVGKTTFVNAAVHHMKKLLEEEGEKSSVYDVHLAIARPMNAVELMHHILRGIHENMRRTGLLNRLPGALREDISLAFVRTSAALTLSTSRSDELQGSKNLLLPFLGGFSLSGSATRSRERAVEYLAYDDKAAESDLIRIARTLRRGVYLKRFLPWHKKATSIRLLVILDELDKIDGDSLEAESESALDEIVNNLKTLLTASGITFVFVAGRDLHDRWLKDLGKGDGVYESIFADTTYVPVAWDQIDPLCDPLVDRNAASERERLAFTHFKGFLAYQGRGIPRRVLRGFNEHVVWSSDTPSLDLSDRRRFVFYDQLMEDLFAREDKLFGDTAAEARSHVRDKQRLASLYICDWMFGRGMRTFTFESAVEAACELSRRIAPDTQVAATVVRNLIELLLHHHYLETPGDATETAEGTAEYRVPYRRLIEMGRYVDGYSDSADGEIELPDFGSRYETSSLLGVGGSCEVYEAVDLTLARKVAIKTVRPGLGEEARQALLHEAEVLAAISGRGIVKLLAAALQEPRPYLVLEKLEGVLLSNIVHPDLQSRLDTVVSLGHQMLNAVQHVHDRGYVWRDAKPGNVFFTREGGVVLFDFGSSTLAGASDSLSASRRGVGTQPYTAPEILRGEPANPAADVFSVCAVLYEQLNGEPPFTGNTPRELLAKMESGPEPIEDLPPEFAKLGILLLRGLSIPEESRPTITDIVAALALVERGPHPSMEDIAERAERVSSRTVFHTVIFEAAPKSDNAAGSITIPESWDDSDAPRSYDGDDAPERTIIVASQKGDDKPRLRIITAEGEEFLFSLRDRRHCSIGRVEENDLTIVDRSVSRFHAELSIDGSRIRVRDLNTANGVLLNGNLLDPKGAYLNNGDVLRVGGSLIHLEL